MSFVERLSSFGGYFVQNVYTRVHLVCPLLGGLSSFRVSFIGGFTEPTYIAASINLVGQGVCLNWLD